MSFDNLITIGIIIYVIYSIKKVFSSQKKDGSGNKIKSTGWAGKLGEFMDNIKEEIEKANQQAMAEKSSDSEDDDSAFWDDIREPSPDEYQADSEPINQALFYEAETDATPPAIEEEIPEVQEESHRNYVETDDRPMPVPGRRKRKAHCFKMKKSDLKKAVIWSEILSKPVSLREHENIIRKN